MADRSLFAKSNWTVLHTQTDMTTLFRAWSRPNVPMCPKSCTKYGGYISRRGLVEAVELQHCPSKRDY